MNSEKYLTHKQIGKMVAEAYRPYWNFLVFTESLRRNNNNTLIESIKAGTIAIMEAYDADAAEALETGVNDADAGDNEDKIAAADAAADGDAAGNSKREARLSDIFQKYRRSPEIVNEIAARAVNKDTGIGIDEANMNQTERQILWVWVYDKAFKIMLKQMNPTATKQTMKNPYAPVEEAAKTLAFDTVNERFPAFDPNKGQSFVAFIDAHLNLKKKQYANEATGRLMSDPWEPGKAYGISKERGGDELHFPRVYCKPGQYNEEGELNKSPLRNVSNKTYKRIIPEEQRRNFRLLREEYENSGTVNDSMVSYYTENKKKFGDISLEIPKDERNIPPDKSPYWLNVYDLEGLTGESSVYNPSVEERGDEDDMSVFGGAIPHEKMSGKSVSEERKKQLEKLEEIDIEKIATSALEGKRNELAKNAIMNIIYSNKVEDYISANTKDMQWEIVGNALANVMKEKYPKMEPVPVYDSKNEQEYLATAYEFAVGKNGTPEEKAKWAFNLLHGVRSAVKYVMGIIKNKIKELIVEEEEEEEVPA